MKSKSGDERVFFFTLIDLFIQIIFLGLLIFSALLAQQKKNDKTGDFKELTDRLSRLSTDGNGLKFVANIEKIKMLSPDKDINKLIETLVKAGGRDKVSCLGSNPDGTVKRLGDVLLQNGTITFLGDIHTNVELKNVVSSLGLSLNEIQTLSASDFKKRFEKLSKKNCVYYLGRCEAGEGSTKLRDALNSGFYNISCPIKFKHIN